MVLLLNREDRLYTNDQHIADPKEKINTKEKKQDTSMRCYYSKRVLSTMRNTEYLV